MAKDKKKDDDQPRSKKKEPANNNLLLILGGVGCAGLLLIACIASAGIGVWWVYSKSDKAKDGIAVNKDKAGKADGAKDNDGKTATGSKLKKKYDQVLMGDHISKVETLMGGRGIIGQEQIPKLTDPKIAPEIAKNKRLLNVNVMRTWDDPETGEILAIGLQGEVVGFKGLYYRVGAETRVEYLFTNTK
jgi:hypothetical protein